MANHDKRDSSGNWLNPTGGPSGQPPARNPASVPTGLASTPSAGVLFLALRRRWPLALGLGLVAAVLAGGVTWLVISPARYMGRTLLHVDPKPPTIAYPSTETPANFSGYQKTQIALVKSRLVLGNALNQPKVAALATVREAVREQLDPIEWLERELKVDFTVGPEILRIAINGDRPQELTVLVDGIREAYLQKIVNKERTERLAKLGQLEEIYNKYQELLRRREQELRKLARSVGTSDLPTVAIKQQLTAERLGLAQKELRQMQAEIRTLQIVMQDQQGKEKSGEELEVPEGLLEQRLTQDPVIEPFRKEVARRQLELEEAKKVAQGALLASYRNRLEAAETKLNAMRDELRPKLIKQLREEVQRRLKDNVLGCQEQLALKKKLEESLQGEVKQLEEQADSLNVGSLDVEWLRRDVAHLEGVTKRIGEQTEALKVELDAPARIKVLEEAVASATNNEKKQVLAALGAALAALALVCYAVARWEYRVRRVHTADEVVSGLGMKLLGTLPDVSARQARGKTKRSKAVERAWDH